MKIIDTDNFNRESESDKVVAENVPEYWAKHIVKFLNERFSSEHSPHFFKAEQDDYTPYTFEP